MTGNGHSPLRPQIACSRSACSVLVGRPVDGPPRCTLTTIIGSSVITARPMPSPLSAMPGPLEAVTAIAPANEAPIVAGHGRNLVLGLEGDDVEVLVLGELVEDVAGRRDRVAAEEQPLAAEAGGGHQSPGQGLVAHDAAVRAGRQLGFGDVVLRVDRLDRFAVVVAGLEGGRVGLGDFGPLAELVLDVAERRIERPVVEPIDQSHGEEVAAAVGVFLAQAEAFHGEPRELGHVDGVKTIAAEAAVVAADWFRSRPVRGLWRRTRRN